MFTVTQIYYSFITVIVDDIKKNKKKYEQDGDDVLDVLKDYQVYYLF
jgi:hypothetical protein